MIAKISATENLSGALGYNFKKVEKEQAGVLLANGVYQNRNGEYAMKEVLRDMLTLIPDKCRTKKIVFHCSLNPHPDEKLSDEELRAIAKEYMTALGYGKQPYIVFKHNDIEREHIHIVSLRVDSHGRKINDKFEGRRSKRITDELERKYALMPSTPIKQNANLDYMPGDTNSKNIKEDMAQILHSVIRHYRFCSLGEFNAILAKFHLAAEEVKTELRGKEYNGLVYIPTDDKGNKTSTPINSSDIGFGVGYTAIQNKMQKSRQEIKQIIPHIRSKVVQAMQKSPETVDAMCILLGKQGIRTIVRKNGGGRIYGITFIDDHRGIAINGSRLGKGYSANVFNNYFSDTMSNPFIDNELYALTKEHTDIQHQKDSATQDSTDNLFEGIIDDFVDGDFVTPTNEDWKEAAWQRKLRKQNKMRLRRKKH